MASLKSREYIFLLVLSSLITFSLVQGAKCPEGFHRIDKGYCCWPISCSKNQQFQLCTQDEGLDSCRACDDGLVTPEQINTSNWSYFYDICHVPECECAPEAILDNPLECKKSGIPVCLCNREKWLYGEDPLNCQKANDALKKSAMERGMELKFNGTVGICPQGYFKALSGSSICSPHSKCPEGHSVEFPGTIVQDIKCKPDPSTSVATRPSRSTSPPSTPPDKVRKSANENNSLLPWVLVGLFAVILIVTVVLLIIGICWMKKRQKSADRMKKNVGVSVDPESGSIQPLIEEDDNKDMSAPTGSQRQGYNEVESTIKFLNKKKQQGTGKEDNNLTLLKKVNNQNEDYQNAAMNSIPADHVEEKGDEERSLLILKNKENVSLAESNENQDSHGCSLPDKVGISMSMSSMLEEPSLSNSEMTSKEGDGLDLNNIPIAQENSYERHSLPTSRDLGIGLSADFKVENEIQKPCQKQTKQKQHVQQHQ